MGTQMRVKYGQTFKKADQYDMVQQNLPKIIKSSNVKRQELIKEIGISDSTFYVKMHDKIFSAEDIIKYITAIIAIKDRQLKELQKSEKGTHT